MKIKSIIPFACLLLFLVSNVKTASSQDATDYWPQWRGPLATGAAVKGNPPTVFSETKNLKWKTPIPGKGHATPIVWGDKIIIETATPHDPGADMESFRNAT